jgi:hypothetical protein
MLDTSISGSFQVVDERRVAQILSLRALIKNAPLAQSGQITYNEVVKKVTQHFSVEVFHVKECYR